MEQERPPVGDLSCKSDDDILRELRFLSERARHNEFQILRYLREFEERKLCNKADYRSLYEYCVHALGFEENEAFRRIKVARILRAYPWVMALLEKRKVSMSALVALYHHLKPDNVQGWMKVAEGKTRREIEALIALRYPEDVQPDAFRRLPHRVTIVAAAPPQAYDTRPSQGEGPPSSPAETGTPIPAASESAPPEAEWAAVQTAPSVGQGWQVLAVVAFDRVRIGFDAASSVASLIERAKQLLRHKYPEGRLEDVVREAFEVFLERKDPQRRLVLKASEQEHPAEPSEREKEGLLPTRFLRAWSNGRYIPARVKSAVWQRDGGRCVWRDSEGFLCGSRDWLEYDHIRPFSKGGRSDDPRNIRLLCREHNVRAAEAAFGAPLAAQGDEGLSLDASSAAAACPSSTPPAASDSPA